MTDREKCSKCGKDKKVIMKWVEKARRDLNAIAAFQCFESYKMANYKNGKKLKKYVAYSVPDEAKKCTEYLFKLVDKKDIKEYEAEIKYFLLPFRTFRNKVLREGLKLIREAETTATTSR